MRVVVDTNLLISRALSPKGRVARITEHLRQGHFEVAASAEILAEYRVALLYPSVAKRHKLSEEEVDALLFPFFQTVVTPPATPPVCRDSHDDMFFACALASAADYIVSDDPDLHAVGTYHGTRVISSGAFLALLESEGGEHA